MTPVAAPETAFEAALLLAAALRAHGVSYAIGGALAYGQHVVPRATNDVDVNIFVRADGLAVVFAALASLGVACEPERDRAAAEAEGMFIAHLGGFRFDADLERAVAFLGGRLDVAYVRRQLVAMMGAGDERIAAWDALVTP